jgi:uncharacterized protein involved in cysteine biosynthesis
MTIKTIVMTTKTIVMTIKTIVMTIKTILVMTMSYLEWLRAIDNSVPSYLEWFQACRVWLRLYNILMPIS